MLAYLTAMKRFGDFDGRATRSEFWLYMLVATVLTSATRYAQAAWHTSVPIGDLMALVHIVPSTTIQIRRLHDTGRSGYWLWLSLTVVGLIPLFYWFCQTRTGGPGGYDDFDALFPVIKPQTRASSAIEPGAASDIARLDSLDRQADGRSDARGAGRQRAGFGWSIGLVVLVGVLAVGALLSKDQILQTIDIIKASIEPAAAHSGAVLAARKARNLDHAVAAATSGSMECRWSPSRAAWPARRPGSTRRAIWRSTTRATGPTAS